MSGLGPLIGEVLGVKAAPIEYHSEGKRRSMRVGDIADAEIEGLGGQDGNDVTVAKSPFAAVPGVPFVVAKSKQMRFNDYGLNWEVSNKNGYFRRSLINLHSRGARERNSGRASQAGPYDRRVWSCGSGNSVVDIPDLHGLGNAPYGCGDGHHARHAALDRFGISFSCF